MSWSVCLYCGERKASALVGCDACELRPASAEHQARHLVAAELPDDEREALARAVARGDEAQLDEAAVQRARQEVEAASGPRLALFALGVLALPFGAIVGGLLLLAMGLAAL
jgi:hypothetical protein